MSIEVLMSNENLSIFGGPASLDVNVDYGAPGVRGSLIFTGPGKPTDAAVSFSTAPRPQDLYINLLPPSALNSESNEYLFLYQFGSINGVLGWSKLFRLIPSTALANIPVLFIDGKASRIIPTAAGALRVGGLQAASPQGTTTETILKSIFDGLVPLNRISPTAPTTPTPTAGMHWVDVSNPLAIVMKSYNGTAWGAADETLGPTNFWLDLITSPTTPQLKRWTGTAFETLASMPVGLLFPISDYFSAEEIAIAANSGFNVQYIIRNETPISSGVKLSPLSFTGSKTYLPVNITAAETIAFSPGSELTWQKINGIRTLNFVLVAGIGELPPFSEV
jgi:hypothetical protein